MVKIITLTHHRNHNDSTFCVLDVLLKSATYAVLCPIRTILFILKSLIITYFVRFT